MSGAKECTSAGVRLAQRAKSPASGDPPDSRMQGSATVCRSGDHRLRQSITIKSKVESSCSTKTAVTCISEKGTRSVVQHRSTARHPEVVRTTAFLHEMSNGAGATINTYEDSRSGIRQLSVGRHIGDRSHLSEKSRNEFTGEEEKSEHLVNIAYEELGGFESEWKQRMGQE
ncbi:myeloid leukemia factor 2 [Rhipicephalus sanguineus]|uniref:Uncharacterized protein n=1 Tax=Rhipicephalus sanguineus TaxID=34632 RepID=A0A9D4QFQ3_RHISA|nr:myeloid leukemia factor 2 [Rhipicephalus sanguineus]KAH7975923.1 hypothetical protein HPB52_006800 [Rhipicephalus sanguineus]